MESSIRKICETKGYSLSEITKINNGKQDILYEVKYPNGDLYKELTSMKEALNVLKEIIFSDIPESAI